MPHEPRLTQVAARLGANLDDAIEEMAVPAYILDRNGTIRWQNERCLALFGDSRGKAFTSVIAPQSNHLVRTQFAKKLLGTERASDYPAVYRTLSGADVPVEIHSVALENGEHVVGVFGIIDIRQSAAVEPAAGAQELTPRQLEILQALARGYSTAQIGEELVISRETVRNHVRGLLRALKVHSRLEAVAEGRRQGLIP